MNKDLIIKIILIILGISCFLICIMQDVEDIGRFPLILFGTLFIFIGSFMKWKK